MSDTITCPQCRAEIEVTEVLSAQLAAGIRAELQTEFADKTQKLAAERSELTRARGELEAHRAEFEDKVKTAVARERESLVAKTRAEVQQAVAVELADRDEQLSVAKSKLKEFESIELDLRSRARKLAAQAEQQELELARKLDEERKTIRETVLKQAEEQSALKLAERDGTIESLAKQLLDAQQTLTTERDDLTKARRELEASRSEFEHQVKAAVEKERESLAAKIRAEAQQAVAIELADRQEELSVARSKLKEFEGMELDLRRKARELDERTEQQELELARKLDAERKSIRETALKQADEQSAMKLAQRDETIEALAQQLLDAQQTLTSERDDLTRARRELEASRSEFEHQVKAAVEKERESLSSKIRDEAQQSVAIELADRDQQLGAARAKVKEFESLELDLRRKARELEERAEKQELEVMRKLDEERKSIREAALKENDEQSALKLAERDHKIEALARQLQEAQRKLEQGSQQTQGDVQEVALESLLAETFPNDVIERVGKGANGGDLLHHVFDHNGRECGTILWESKRTKRWDGGWIGKAIADQQEAKATCVCIVTAAMPDGADHIGECSNVWISSWKCARSAALALRRVLIEASQARRATDGQHSKMELVYNYLSGPEFRNRVQGLIEPYLEMEKDLQSEMRAWHSRLKRRRKQLDRAMMSMTGLYGDLQGIIGSSLQEIEGMSLLALESSGSGDGVESEEAA
jgi:hypothetical protein